MQPLLSIVIPTKNRYDTLFPLIEALSEFTSENLEVVVHDNSDDNNQALEFFDALHDQYIRYYYCKDWLSVVDNCDKAINNSTGRYISFIGDDDAIAPEIVEVAELMEKYKIDSCSCNYSIFKWYSDPERNIYPFEYIYDDNVLQVPDCDRLIKRALKNGIQNKKSFPGVYHGITSRALLDKIYKLTGSYFPGPSPDMANAFALALAKPDCHMNISVPVVVDGYSKVSTGRLTETKRHIGKLEEQTFLPKDTVDNWTPELPKIWLPNTIWPQSAIQAIKRSGRSDLLRFVNYEAIYIKIGIQFPEFREMCRDYSKQYSSFGKKVFSIFRISIVYVKNRIRNMKRKKKHIIKEQISVKEAIHETSKLIREGKMIEALEEKLSHRG